MYAWMYLICYQQYQNYTSFLKDNNKNNYVCDVKYITTYNYFTTRFQMLTWPKKAPRDAYFH